MKLAVKILSVLVLIALSSPVILLKGCGEMVTGGACGGCPDSTAPYGSTITAPDGLGIPSAASGTCYPALTFTVLGPDNEPIDNICVEIFTNGAIALHSGLPNCTNVILSPSQSILTRTNTSGAVTVEFATPAGAAAGSTFFVEVVSCHVSAIVTTPGAI